LIQRLLQRIAGYELFDQICLVALRVGSKRSSDGRVVEWGIHKHTEGSSQRGGLLDRLLSIEHFYGDDLVVADRLRPVHASKLARPELVEDSKGTECVGVRVEQ
jgi:hypothetical protein